MNFKPPFPDPPPDFKAVTDEWLAYVTGRKRLPHAYTVLTLCRFGRWVTLALLPRWSFFSCWIEAEPGHISTEEKARLSLRKPISYWEAIFQMSLPVALAMMMGVSFRRQKRWSRAS